MNFTGNQSSTTLKVNLNTNGGINTNSNTNPNPPSGSFLYNSSPSVIQGQIPVFTGLNLNEVIVSQKINESNDGININGSLAIPGFSDVALTLNNIQTVINNLTGIMV